MLRFHTLTACIAFVGCSFLLGCSSGSDDASDTPDIGVGGAAGQTGDDAGATGETSVPDEQDAAPEADPPAELSPACAVLQHGINEGFDVDGMARSFILDLPDGVDAGGPWPVVFNWHGLGDSAQNMRQLLSSQVNRQDFPFIAVTPEDTDYTVGAVGMSMSMDWDAFDGSDSNREVRLYDEILACLDARWGIDADHVHQTGFSIGAITADLIGVLRGEQVASIATYSGGYFSDEKNVESIGMLSLIGIDWPQPSHGNPYPQMMLFGGDKDVWSPSAGVSVKFFEFAENDRKALLAAGQDVVYCNHGGGHMAPPPGMNGARLVDFFRDHPRGLEHSPFATAGLPDDYADYCEMYVAGEDEK